MYKWMIVVAMALVLTGCGKAEEEGLDPQVGLEAEYRSITAEEAKALMVEGNLIVDVRTKEEYDQGHIEGALRVGVDTITGGTFEAFQDINQVILVYCRSGNRSATAAEALIEAGYTGVYDFGGILDWPYEIVKTKD